MTPQLLALANQIRQLVQDRDYVSWYEIRDLLKPNIEVKGGWAYELEERNIILWVGMSREFLDIMIHLMTSKILEICPCRDRLSVLAIYGGNPTTMPIVGNALRYKKPRWLPCTLRLFGAHDRDEAQKKTKRCAPSMKEQTA